MTLGVWLASIPKDQCCPLKHTVGYSEVSLLTFQKRPPENSPEPPRRQDRFSFKTVLKIQIYGPCSGMEQHREANRRTLCKARPSENNLYLLEERLWDYQRCCQMANTLKAQRYNLRVIVSFESQRAAVEPLKQLENTRERVVQNTKAVKI